MCSFFHALFHLFDALAELVGDDLLRIFRSSLASEDIYRISKYGSFISPEILASYGAISCFHESDLVFIIHGNRRYSDVKDLLDDSKRKRIVVCYTPQMIEVRLIVKVFLIELFQLGDIIIMHSAAPGLYHKGKVF